MTSEERHKNRYIRRKVRRDAKAKEMAEKYSDFDDIFGFHALLDAYKNCKKGVMCKSSTQAYKANLLVNTADTARRLKEGTWKSRGFHEFDIIERGKPRHIKSVHISERVIQRSLCDNCLIPILRRSMIYDNGASLEGKGTDFALERITCHIQRYCRKYGRTGGIYLFDFSNYFGNIQNYPLTQKVRKKIFEEKVLKYYEKFIFAFGEKGLGLGSQVSQISAIYYPNNIDHFIKDQLSVKFYGRYMDDGYIIHHDLKELRRIADAFEKKCEESGIILNKKKCRIIKLHKQFKFLKIRFFVTKSGKVVKRISREAVTKERNRLRKFKGFLTEGKMTLDEICKSFHAWLRSQKRGKSYHIKRNMIRYFNDLYREEGVQFVPNNYRGRKKRVFRDCVIYQKAR